MAGFVLFLGNEPFHSWSDVISVIYVILLNVTYVLDFKNNPISINLIVIFLFASKADEGSSHMSTGECNGKNCPYSTGDLFTLVSHIVKATGLGYTT